MATTALVTGATAGLGAEFARQLAAAKHDLVLVARDETRLAATAGDLLDAHGVQVETLSADLATDEGQDAVAARLGDPERPVDLLVNNAGIGTYQPFGTADWELEARQLDVNVRAVLHLSHAAVRAMTARGSGRVLNVSSVAGFVPRSGNATYSASKAWVTMFSEALALQLAGTGVTVTAVCPGFTHTEFHERASADMSGVPARMWLEAADVVREGLADAVAGKPVSVPSKRYKALVGVSQTLPRPILREIMRRRGM
ncbi:SDR family oxidoreductase [Jatrophihabitans endophyticus]|uniref:SDR family NAD(P)-dependent oxidoreductase n=1 Tax=Jatrophihabitans endophyticus TaxID=1206085 RepID=UPI0019EC5259|nr:SDR family oxidoreductase [Jatrophihabitans endophyticus]MBE7189001.1 SDR family oxidoreductase [Jatrophihabitans endophyticus]